MATYVILSKLQPGAYEDPSALKKVSKEVSKRIKKECPDVVWKESYALKGRYDVVDIIESDDEAQVDRAAMIIKTVGKAQTETMTTTPWDEFLKHL